MTKFKEILNCLLDEGSDDWKKIYSKCPKCGSTDIFSVNMDKKECNECSHKWDTNAVVKNEGMKFDSGLKLKAKSPEDADSRFDSFLKKRVAELLKKAKTEEEKKMITTLLKKNEE